MNASLAQLTVFGKEVKKRLVDIGRPQEWLIERVHQKTDMFFDRGYLYKILTGQRSAPKVIQAIREILELPEQEEHTT